MLFRRNNSRFRSEKRNNPSSLVRSWFTVYVFGRTTFIELAVSILSIYVLIIRSWLCPKCTFTLLYTTLILKSYKINNATGASAKSKKVRDVSKEGGGELGSPEERPYDVSRGQNRFATLPQGHSNG